MSLLTGSLSVGSNTVWHAGNDGSGSGLDADTVDGYHLSNLATGKRGNYSSLSGSSGQWYPIASVSDGACLISIRTYAHSGVLLSASKGYTASGTANVQVLSACANANGGYANTSTGVASSLAATTATDTIYDQVGIATGRSNFREVRISDNTAWHAGNDGSGSGLDADTVDGVHASSFLRNHQSGEIAGNLTLDNQNPVLQLEADGNYSSYIRFSNGSALQDGEISYAPAIDTMYFRVANTGNRMSLAGSAGNLIVAGNVTAYSDERLKEEIKVIGNAVDKVKELRGVTYKHKEEGDYRTGVIAQEVEKVLPEAVIHNEDSGMLSVAYGNMVGLLIEAIKELKTEVDDLKTQIAEKG